MSKVIKPVKKKKKPKNYYFSQITENAIIRYNNTDEARLKNIIYNEHISYAFDKLAENIKNISVGKDAFPHVVKEETKTEQKHEDPVLENKHRDLFDELFGDKS